MFSRIVVSFILIFLTIIAFFSIKNNDFINLDDNIYITENEYIKDGLTLKNIKWAFTNTNTGHWHPLTWISHLIDIELFGLNPTGHHVVNLIFHIINSLLCFYVFNKATGKLLQSGFLGGLFAIHPLRVESVAWVAERKDVLFAFFLFLSILVYIKYKEKPNVKNYIFIIIFFAFSLLSKPMAVTLPFILILFDLWPLSQISLKERKKLLNSIYEKLPLFFFSLLSSLITLKTHLKAGAISSFYSLPIQLRIENAIVSYTKYIFKMFWPTRLAVLYPHPIHIPFFEFIAATLILFSITCLVFLLNNKKPYLIVGWLYYLGTLFPVIGIIQVGIQAMADRFTYIPLIGLFIMIVFGVSDLVNRFKLNKTIFISLGIFILLILAILSSMQVARWRDSITLFNHTLNVTSNNYIIHNNLGVSFMRQKKYNEAFINFKKAIEIKPNYADSIFNLGILSLIRGDDEEALRFFNLALKYQPDNPTIHNLIGTILAKKGFLNEAMTSFNEAIKIKKDYGEVYYNIGTCLLMQGKFYDAINNLYQALRLNYKNYKVYNNLAIALDIIGKKKEAFEHYKEALHIDPNHIDFISGFESNSFNRITSIIERK